MNEWIQTNWLGLAALIVAIIGIPITVFATRRWGNRRAKLQLSIESTRLLAEGDVTEKLEVTFDGNPVKNPYLNTLWIKNSGSRDIPSSAFENDLRIKISGRFFEFIDIKTNNGVSPVFMSDSIARDTDSSVILVPPRLIPKGTVWMVKFLTSGKSKIISTDALLDTDIPVVNVPNIALLEATADLSRSILPWPFSIFFDAQLEKIKDSHPR